MRHERMKIDPVLRHYLNNFKKSYEIVTTSQNGEENQEKESSAFEKFINYTIFSVDYPGIFTANVDLLDFVTVGGQHDTGIDGIGIKVNGKLVKNTEEVIQIVDISKKVEIEFIFIQSKMRLSFDATEFNSLHTGVSNFFSEKSSLPENDKIKEFRAIKDFVYSDERVIEKLDTNPSLFVYYIALGTVPTDDHFIGIKKIIEKNLLNHNYCHFKDDGIRVELLGRKEIVALCQELDNKYTKQIVVTDIFPLMVKAGEDKVKKSYAFTCEATELLKLLTKEDGTLRRALFNDNVRDYLEKSAVNKEIEKTITDSPEMFLLCNNGITIVCSGFEQVKDKLVKIENPQIVNGCQTSNSIFKYKDHPNIGKVQILVRLISTENLEVSNQIVRGTNKQNQVLEEAFEATLPFHKEALEPFFQAVNESSIKIYYERRIKQYSNDPLITKTQIVNLRILTQTFIAMFLEDPHNWRKHEAKLLETYAGKDNRKIYLEDHSPYPYYIAALTWYMFDKYFRDEKIDRKYGLFRGHFYLIFKYSIGQYSPTSFSLDNSRKSEGYFRKLLEALKEPAFGNQVDRIIRIFEDTKSIWINDKDKSKDGIADVANFSKLLREQCRKTFIGNQKEPEQDKISKRFEGTIMRMTVNRYGLPIGFIKCDHFENNLYFDSRDYDGEIKKLSENQKVSFEPIDNEGKKKAIGVRLIN